MVEDPDKISFKNERLSDIFPPSFYSSYNLYRQKFQMLGVKIKKAPNSEPFS